MSRTAEDSRVVGGFLQDEDFCFYSLGRRLTDGLKVFPHEPNILCAAKLYVMKGGLRGQNQ